jgi:hypothetical protein
VLVRGCIRESPGVKGYDHEMLEKEEDASEA